MSGNKRHICFQKGKFFVFVESQSKSGKWLALGPDRAITIPFITLLLLASFVVSYVFRYTESSYMAYAIIISYISTLISYFHTALCDPGIVRPSEDNSIENRDSLEPLGYSYCSICNLYRPPNSYHCNDCNLCFLDHDHHCTFMGQCVAKNNTVSFYVFLFSLIVWLVLLEICGMTLLVNKPVFSKRTSASLISIFSKAIKTAYLRK